MSTTPDEVEAYLDKVTPAVRRRDARTLLEMVGRITGEPPQLWGSIVGFGTYHYKYASGHEGDCAAAGFAPRKSAMSIYLVDGIAAHTEALAELGPHTHGVGCLYVTDLDSVDLDVLESIIESSYRRTTHDVDTEPAREGGATGQ